MRNLLCLTGDHQNFGNHPTAKNVFDIDSIQMLRMVSDMRDERLFQNGDPFDGQEPRFFVGAAAAPFADPIPFRPYRLAKKVKAGADFIQTQLVYDVDAFAEFMEKVRELGLHEKTFILAGVGPLKSPGMGRYMKNNVPGILVPDKIIKRMTDVGGPWAGKKKDELTKEDKRARSKAWKEEGIQVCIDLIKKLKEIEGVVGVHIMAIEWEEAIKPIVEGASLYPRPSLEVTTSQETGNGRS
jgi:methylenetetrahydrofolate reductase (NADPH)